MINWGRLYSTDSAKAAKASGFGYINAIHYMAPGNAAGAGNMCPHMSAMCSELCLGMYSGQAAMVSDLEHGTNSVRESRIMKARLFMADRHMYMNQMARQLFYIKRRAEKDGLQVCARPNGSSDNVFERIRFFVDEQTSRLLGVPVGTLTTLHALFSDTQFVDYTKNFKRLGKAPANLHLVFSFSGDNHDECKAALAGGHSVAIVFGHGLPDTWWGHPVINGDTHDLRHLDPANVVVGLTPKGHKAKKSMNGFVMRDY